MHNFFALEVGDKWARTGTKFRPLGPRGFPPPEIVKRGNSPEVSFDFESDIFLFWVFDSHY